MEKTTTVDKIEYHPLIDGLPLTDLVQFLRGVVNAVRSDDYSTDIKERIFIDALSKLKGELVRITAKIQAAGFPAANEKSIVENVMGMKTIYDNIITPGDKDFLNTYLGIRDQIEGERNLFREKTALVDRSRENDDMEWYNQGKHSDDQ